MRISYIEATGTKRESILTYGIERDEGDAAEYKRFLKEKNITEVADDRCIVRIPRKI